MYYKCIELDGSTCGEEDFHWIKTEPPSEQRTVSPSSSAFTKDSSVSNSSGIPPKPPGSLDRRRFNPKNRHERDIKSRSSHSLKEKKNDLQGQQHHGHHFNHSTDYLQHFGGSQFMLHEHPSMPCLANGNMAGCSWASRENLQKQAELFRSQQDLMQQCRYPMFSPAAAMYCHCNYPFNSTSTLTLPHMMCPTTNGAFCGQQQVWLYID